MSDQGVYDSTDPAAIEAARRDAERREAEDNETLRIWMNHPKGRDLLFRIVFDVCHHAETFMATDQKGRSDVPRTYYHLGERNIGAWFDDRLRRHPDLYMQMLKEQELEREVRASRLKKQNEKQDEAHG